MADSENTTTAEPDGQLVTPEQVIPEPDALLDDLEDGADDLVLDFDEPPAPVGRSWAFDFGRNLFLWSPGQGPQETHGDLTIRFWVEKALRTPRGVFPIYSDSYGMPDPHRLIGEVLDPALVASYVEDIRDTLLYHPRITAVEQIEIQGDPTSDILFVSFRVVYDEGAIDFDAVEVS